MPDQKQLAVLVFAGHMIDAPGRAKPRFPPELEDAVSRLIRTEIIRRNGQAAYAAAASGSDILFLEQMLALKREVNIVLPVEPAAFKERSVKAAGASWLDRFDNLLPQAVSLQVVEPSNPASFSSSLAVCNLRLCELAAARAKQKQMALFGLAVLDCAQPGTQSGGGTASMIALWRQQGIRYSCIRLDSAPAICNECDINKGAAS